MKTFYPLLLLSVLFTGCASQYVVALKNGQGVIAAGKPQLAGFNYVFVGVDGRTNVIPSTYVRAIVPYSPKRAPGK